MSGMVGGESVFAKPSSVLPPGGGYYGGGKIAAKFSATDQSSDAQVLLHVANNRHTVRVGALLWSKCSGPGVTPSGNGVAGSNPATGTLRRDGKFSGQVSYPTQGTAGKFQNTFKFSGHFTSAERAVGTVDIEGVNVANHSIRCGTGRISFEIDDPTLSRGSGAFTRGAAYFGANDAGPTAQGLGNPPFGQQPVWPMLLRTASHGRSVALVTYFFSTTKCQKSSNSISQPEFGPPPANVKRDGSFTEVDRYDAPLGGGFTGHFTDTVNGRFGGHRAHGSVRVDVTVASATGAVVDHCTTGNRKWAAVRGGSG